MKLRKVVTSIVVLVSLVLSLVSSISPAFAVDPSDQWLYEDPLMDYTVPDEPEPEPEPEPVPDLVPFPESVPDLPPELPVFDPEDERWVLEPDEEAWVFTPTGDRWAFDADSESWVFVPYDERWVFDADSESWVFVTDDGRWVFNHDTEYWVFISVSGFWVFDVDSDSWVFVPNDDPTGFEGFEAIDMASLDIGFESFSIVAASTTSSTALRGRTIVLDPGHGVGSDNVYMGYSEQAAMLYLTRQVRARLQALGATVVLTRDADPTVSLQTRCAIINVKALETVRDTRTNAGEITEINNLIAAMNGIIRNPAVEGSRLMNTPFDARRTIHPTLRRVFEWQNTPVIKNNFLAISLHSNAASNSGARGAEAYYISPSEFLNTRTYYPGFSYSAQSRGFANTLLNHINGTGMPRRASGLRAENYFFIREINVPSVLAENGFHTNPTDRSLLLNTAFLNTLAQAYTNATVEYFGALSLHQPTNPATITVVERVGNTNRPIANARVDIGGRTFTTGANGVTPSFQLAGGTTHNFTVFAGNDFFSQPDKITVGSGAASATVRMERIAGTQIGEFTTRLYREVLGRAPDAGGLHYWASRLRNGTVTGASAAQGFFLSAEYRNRKESDADFVIRLYKTLLNRNPDKGGETYWLGRLDTGLPRENIFGGFVNSAEFTRLCGEYGITRGTYKAPAGGMARVFATRLYREALGRNPDAGGLDYWHKKLKSGTSGSSVARGFIFSKEVANRGLTDTNEKFVEMLYKTMLGRPSDAGGRAYWLGRLENGSTRRQVFNGFANSKEFTQLCKSHGIKR